MIDGWLARKLQAESKTGSVLDSIADLLFVACCAIQLLPTMSIPSWLWIWAGIIVIIKIVNQLADHSHCNRSDNSYFCSNSGWILYWNKA